jgi:predicted O-linked N-acetylglucosamine transferase (SPINDLY family)
MNDVQAMLDSALKQHQAGNVREAEVLYRQVLQIDPRHPGALHLLGVLASQAGRYDHSIAYISEALRLLPNYAEAHNNLGFAFQKQGDYVRALECYQRALQLKPDSAEIHFNVGTVLRELNRLPEALASFRRAVQNKPGYAEAHGNLGAALQDLGQFQEGLAEIDHALQLNPNNAEAHVNRALNFLLHADFQRGWPEYEWRWHVGSADLVQRKFPQPLWDGSSITGKRILLYSDQGVGDTIQMIRYAAVLQKQGGHVLFECPQRLFRLLRTCPGINEFVPPMGPRGTSPTFDVHAPLMSLPGIMKTNLGNIPGGVPYLSADAGLRGYWRTELSRFPGFRIGIAWQGNPKHKGDCFRSLSLALFEPLARIEGVRLISLQKGLGTEQLGQVHGRFPVIDLGVGMDETAGAFMDTAAVMKQLDLIITSDTSIAHLAGALGVPVWLALSLVPDWRWLLQREDSPWYPSMRLFRQSTWGDWPEVFARISAALQQLKPQGEVIRNLGVAAENPQGSEYLTQRRDIQEMLDSALALHQKGDMDQAELLYRLVLQANPNHPVALHLLGVLAGQLGRDEISITYISHALRIKPDYADAHSNLGFAFMKQGNLDKAAASFQDALRVKPDFAEVHHNLGLVWRKQGKHGQALASFRQAVRFRPNFYDAWSIMGDACWEMGDVTQSLASLRQALSLRPNVAALHNKVGILLKEQGNLDEAIFHVREALRLQPNFVEGYNNLASLFKEQSRLDEAIAVFRAGCRIKPDAAYMHSNLLYDLSFHPTYDAKAIFEEAWRWNQQHAEPLRRFIVPHTNDRNPDRRLRIGYVSADFRAHCQALFTIPLLANHDHRQFEIVCYADVPRPDPLTERLHGYADVWRSTVGLNDQQIADMIRADRIDILVDLSMHMANNRLLVFARKPAPVQVSWLAYPGTTGLSAIDYRLTDPYLDPPGLDDAFYSETSVRLPDTFWCYDPLCDPTPRGEVHRTPRVPLVNDLPAAAGNAPFTFGCLNNFCKVNDGGLTLWASVLRAVPGSRLLLLAPTGTTRDGVLDKFRRLQIAPERVEFVPWLPRPEYLKLHHRIDLNLDPIPYNGHTTSLDGFWMGVPTVTLVGKTVVGRAGWSQLSNLELPELAGRTPEQYVQIAVEWAGDLTRLRKLRATLRQRMEASPLMNGKLFAHNMENAFRQMWRRFLGL